MLHIKSQALFSMKKIKILSPTIVISTLIVRDNLHELSNPVFLENKKNIPKCCLLKNFTQSAKRYEGESISNQPNLFPVEIHLFFFDVIAP